MTPQDIYSWIVEENETRLSKLWAEADNIREKHVGNAVHLRGLIEISNHCERRCSYCGINAENTGLRRYRMSETEIFECVDLAVRYNYGTVVLQAGEDYGISTESLVNLIRKIKEKTLLAVTLSLGERPLEELKVWRGVGADRYLLRFETSDQELYNRIHPSAGKADCHRLEQLAAIQELGYEIGSGIMVGIPGQSFASIIQDLILFREMDLDMIGVGPWLPHPSTVLGSETEPVSRSCFALVPNTDLMTSKVLALARILCPEANIPATTALAIATRCCCPPESCCG